MTIYFYGLNEEVGILKKLTLLFAFFFGLYLNFSFAQTINISELYQNNSFGVPQLLDQIVTIRGEVTVTDQFYIPGSVEDTTGGVAIYDDIFVSKVNIGDVVTISGTVTQFNGLTELKNVNILEHTPHSPSIEPQVITCQDIATEGANGIEKFEGKLVRINDVTVNTSDWNVTGSGYNYTLTDNTGSCEIRIDKDTDIANTPAPTGNFDLIGVVAQYDPSSPFTQGYQLMPRFIEDIILYSGPRLISGPDEKDITPYSMTITWSTATPANSIIKYGETSSYEIDSLTIEESVIQHEVMLNGLSPATVYHVKVGSGDSTGTNYFSDHIVITSSDPASTGEINVYFNKSIDPSLTYPDNQANGNQNLEQKLIQRINTAQYSIDFCFYSWNLAGVTNAILNAHQRNVKIRFIYDHEHNQYQVRRLKQAGITVIDNAFGNNDGTEIQHNKFAIFDARDNTTAIDDWVWTGSLNLTDANELGVYAAQNVIEIQDQALAKAYTIEFNEMWGSDGDTPNANQSRFGPNKLDNTPHKFIINNSPMEMYLCPSDRATSKIINAINSADYEIYFCILAFTRIDVKQAMYEKFSNINGFVIRGVFDSDQSPISQYFPMHGQGDYAWNSPADVWLDQEWGVLHHKYMIIDAHHPNSDPIVITGSQNWSTSAETSNDENTLIIHDAIIANKYLQEFADRYHAAGGIDDLTKVEDKILAETPRSFTLYQNYPNPFNSSTIIRYELIGNSNHQVELSIFNLLGQKLTTLVNQKQPGGFYTVQWDGKNDFGDLVSSGIYVYQLKVEDFKIEKKLVFLQ